MELQFTVPTLSTDRQPLAGKHGGVPLSGELCRGMTVSGPCVPVHTQPVLPGEIVKVQDTLPATLQTGPPVPLYYRVTVGNAQGRRSVASREAVAAAGAAPPPIAALVATTTRRGIQLTWQAAVPATGTIAIQARTGDSSRNLSVAGDPGGAVDRAPHVGDTVTYTVVRAVALPGATAKLQGRSATVTAARTADTFAPALPTGLVAVAVQLDGAAPEIDLSWEPSADTDVAGYLVERAVDAQPMAPLAPAAPATSYRDLAVQPGHAYRYAVRAVDRNGNRSQPSAAATEQLRP